MRQHRGVGRRHDEIQNDLKMKLRGYYKRHLGDIAWDEDRRNEQPWLSDSLLKEEWQYKGEMPSDKDYCRIDIAMSIGDDAWALEIKTSENDLKRWPEQRDDYAAIGMTPVVVVPTQLVWETAPGHRIITDNHHIAIDGYTYHWVGDNLPPKIGDHFEIGAPYELPPDRCPGCGYKMRYFNNNDGTGIGNCMACDVSIQ